MNCIRSKSLSSLIVVITTLLLVLIACQSSITPSSQIGVEDQDTELNILTQALQEVVVLYDDQRASSFSFQSQALSSSFGANQGLRTQAYNEVDGAKITAQIIANLVGGSKGYRAVIRPISAYKAGDAFNAARVIYAGTTYNHPIPQAFVEDINKGAPVTWLSYNIWKLGDTQNLGFSYQGIEAASTARAAGTSFNTIRYNGYDFKKELRPMEMVKVSAASDTKVLAWALKPSGERTPYALQKGSFWYIADIPTSWVYERDRYLVFTDLVPKMLGVELSCEPRALIRVEDVKPADNAVDLNRVFTMLEELTIPFGIATVPLGRDELKNETTVWTDNQAALDAVLTAQDGMGEVFQHGYTHTYDGLANPSGKSGEDWEFWNINTNGPIPSLSPQEAAQRVADGKSVLEALGLLPRGWVTPHYAADPDYYPGFRDIYWRNFERRMISSGDTFAGQLFTYPVRDSLSRALILPENANFISKTNSLENILETAKANKALSCPWLGMFIHPYLFNPDYNGTDAVTVSEFKQFVTDLRGLGYEFQKLSSVTLNGEKENQGQSQFTSAAVVQHSKLCMDAWRSPLFQWECKGWMGQTFDFIPVAENTDVFTLKNKASNDCVSVLESRLEEGADVGREICMSDVNQQFKLKPVGDYFHLISVNSKLCIDIQSKALWGGADLKQKSCDSAQKSQLWQLPGK